MLPVAETFAFSKEAHVRNAAKILRSIGYDVNPKSISGMSVRAKEARQNEQNKKKPQLCTPRIKSSASKKRVVGVAVLPQFDHVLTRIAKRI